jgi:hypothetical protein
MTDVGEELPASGVRLLKRAERRGQLGRARGDPLLQRLPRLDLAAAMLEVAREI